MILMQPLTQYPRLETVSTLPLLQYLPLLESGSRPLQLPQQKRHYRYNHQCQHQERDQDSQSRQHSPVRRPPGTSLRHLERVRDVPEPAIITAHYLSRLLSRHSDLNNLSQRQQYRHFMEVYRQQQSLNNRYRHRRPSWDHSRSTIWPGNSLSLQNMSSRRSQTRLPWIIRVSSLEP
jgi:hypothetical protein